MKSGILFVLISLACTALSTAVANPLSDLVNREEYCIYGRACCGCPVNCECSETSERDILVPKAVEVHLDEFVKQRGEEEVAVITREESCVYGDHCCGCPINCNCEKRRDLGDILVPKDVEVDIEEFLKKRTEF